MNKKGLIIGCIVFVLLIAGASVLYNKLSKDNAPDDLITYEENEGELGNTDDEKEDVDLSEFAAPDFTVYDGDGNAVKLSDFKGKPVVLNFWASWCPPCKREMPDFNEKYLEYKDSIHFVMVNLTDGKSETPDNAQDFLKANGYVFPLYHDLAQNAARTYKIYSIPLTLFINADGSLFTTHTGAMNEKTFTSYLEEIMK